MDWGARVVVLGACWEGRVVSAGSGEYYLCGGKVSSDGVKVTLYQSLRLHQRSRVLTSIKQPRTSKSVQEITVLHVLGVEKPTPFDAGTSSSSVASTSDSLLCAANQAYHDDYLSRELPCNTTWIRRAKVNWNGLGWINPCITITLNPFIDSNHRVTGPRVQKYRR